MRSHNLPARYADLANTIAEDIERQAPDVIITSEIIEDAVESTLDNMTPEESFKLQRVEPFNNIEDFDEVTLYVSHAETTQC